MRVRSIEERDLEVVRDLRNRNRDWFFDAREVSAEQHRAWFEALPNRRIRFYVIEEDDDVVGTLSVTDTSEGREVGNLVLDDAYRGRGLMARALELVCTEPGPYFAYVKPDNEASRRLFERAGFGARHIHFERR